MELCGDTAKKREKKRQVNKQLGLEKQQYKDSVRKWSRDPRVNELRTDSKPTHPTENAAPVVNALNRIGADKVKFYKGYGDFYMESRVNGVIRFSVKDSVKLDNVSFNKDNTQFIFRATKDNETKVIAARKYENRILFTMVTSKSHVDRCFSFSDFEDINTPHIVKRNPNEYELQIDENIYLCKTPFTYDRFINPAHRLINGLYYKVIALEYKWGRLVKRSI